MRDDNEQRRKSIVVLTVVLLAFSAVLLPRSAALASQATTRKIREWQQESREVVRFSIRAYRLYKNCSQPPVVQASNCD
jgi:hypothetical protein